MENCKPWWTCVMIRLFAFSNLVISLLRCSASLFLPLNPLILTFQLYFNYTSLRSEETNNEQLDGHPWCESSSFPQLIQTSGHIGRQLTDCRKLKLGVMTNMSCRGQPHITNFPELTFECRGSFHFWGCSKPKLEAIIKAMEARCWSAGDITLN